MQLLYTVFMVLLYSLFMSEVYSLFMSLFYFLLPDHASRGDRECIGCRQRVYRV